MAESAAASYMQKASDRITMGQWRKRPDATQGRNSGTNHSATSPKHTGLLQYYEAQTTGTSVQRTFHDILEDKKQGDSDTIVKDSQLKHLKSGAED